MNALLLLFIFGLGHPSREPVDPAKSVQLHSRIPCDGFGGPEDAVHVRTMFSTGGSAREFVVNRFFHERCEVDVKVKCLHKEKEGWHDVWTGLNAQPSGASVVPLESCYEWGSSEAAQYILSGWYQDVAADSKDASKAPWRQATVKQVSAQPEVYEFTDASGGTARLEIKR